MAAPQKLDICLEGLGAFQEGAALLKAGDPLCLQQQEGMRLACVTQGGATVGLVPADKRGLLSRGPWSGTVRSVKRQAAAHAAQAGNEAADAVAAPTGAAALAETPPSAAGGDEAGQQDQQQRTEQEQAASAAQQQPVGQVVQQVLVRFTPEEQRWQRRQDPGLAAAQQAEEEDTARLSNEQLQQLAADEEVRWMLRDERLQRVVAGVDAASDRERALVRALQAPNFKEFADKVLAVVAPEEP